MLMCSAGSRPRGAVRSVPVLPMVMGLLATWLVAAGTMPAASAQAVEAAGSPADVTAIRTAAATYREALAKGDAAAIKAAWTADGDIVDGWGNRLEAQAAAGPVPAAAGPRPEFHLSETQLRFITADVAVEDGTVDVVLPGMKTPIEGWFSALWVRRGDGWKLAGVRESERPVVADADMLADLEWMVGEWVLQIDGAESQAAAMEMSVRWDAGQSFLIREARVPILSSSDGGTDMVEVHQRIGWDPLVRRIRSWSFSSDGSRSEATWFRDGESWVAERTAVMPNGRQETAVNIYSYDGQDRCIWRTLPEAMESDDGRPTHAIWVRKPKGVAR